MSRRAPATSVFEACGLSDVGLSRPNNEDVWGEIEELNFFVLADGMGGHRAGEVASREAVSFLLEGVKNSFLNKTPDLVESEKELASIIRQVNKEVFKLSKKEPEYKGMGTTLSCLMLRDTGALVANVGDSRVYRFRNQKLQLLTRDDSLLRELIDLGQITEQSNDFAYKNIITKAVGTEAKLEPSMTKLDLKTNDLFLLTTDGLTDLIQFTELESLMVHASSVESLCLKLIEIAKGRGGYDNMTALVVRYKGNDISR